jgi:hypothetical protein
LYLLLLVSLQSSEQEGEYNMAGVSNHYDRDFVPCAVRRQGFSLPILYFITN